LEQQYDHFNIYIYITEKGTIGNGPGVRGLVQNTASYIKKSCYFFQTVLILFKILGKKKNYLKIFLTPFPPKTKN